MNQNKDLRDAFKRGIVLGAGFLVVLCAAFAGMVFAQSLTTFSSGQVVSASTMNANFDALKTRMDTVETTLQASIVSGDSALNTSIMDRVAPIGGIIAWHNTIGGVPTLPTGWVLCDGNVITDPDSPMNGQNTPNLNGTPNAWNAGGYYLRGSTSAGGTQVDTFQGHRHNRNPAGVVERDMTEAPGSFNRGGTISVAFNSLTATVTGDPVAGLNGAPRAGDETRPVSFTVVWIMRIK